MDKEVVLTHATDDDLSARSKRLVRTTAPLRLAGTALSIQFLRGVLSRASLCVPAYYYFLGSASSFEAAKATNDYPFKVAQTYSEFSDLNTLTLSCRKLFDHARKPYLTGGNFSKLSDKALEDHAMFWARDSSSSEADAFAALRFLRRFFQECSKSDSQLLRAESQLQRRIGLLKQHADRAAAHLSLEDYALDIVDLTHFTAACVVIGEIIRSFDQSHVGPDYFSNLDVASYQAAKRVFPQIPEFQLFGNWNLEKQARLYWKWDEDHGIDLLLNQVHHAVGGPPKLVSTKASF